MPTTKVQKLDGFWVDEERNIFVHMDFIADGQLMIDTWAGKPGEPIITNQNDECIASVTINLNNGEITENLNKWRTAP